MKLFYLIFLTLLQIQAPPVLSCVSEDHELAVFVRGGLHTNHYWASDHTALVEVSEAKEKETDFQGNPAGFGPVSTFATFSPYFLLPLLNPQKLQWTHLSLFVLLRNFRL